MPLYEGQQVGPYTIVSQLGQGGMATVYKAYHAKLDRHVAIKVMHQAFQQDPNFHARFEREAQIVARLEHPHIVPVYDYSEIEGQPYLVMKYIEGRTLKNRLSEGPLTLDQIIQIMTPVADALTYAHQHGVLHRDIKPSNIVIDQRGVPYLTDFGLARIAQAGESTMSHDVILGTPQYISPEQARGDRDLDAHTDVYSLGVILYELVVGRVPFNADTPYATVHDHIYSPLPQPSAVNPEVPPAVEAVLVKALAKNPAERFASPNDMINAFRQAVNQSGLRALSPDRGQTADDALAQLHQQNYAPSVPPAIPAPRPPAPPSPPMRRRRDAQVQDARIDFGEIGDQIKRNIGSGSNLVGQIVTSIQEAIEENKRPLSEEEQIRRKIEKRQEEKQGLIIHLLAFIIINLFLWLLWASSPDSFPWPLIVTGGWGIGMFAHVTDYYTKYGGGAERRERLIQQEIERERQRRLESAYFDEKPKRDRRVRLTDEGELEEVTDDEDAPVEKRKRR